MSNNSPWGWDLADEYEPRNCLWRERGWNVFESDPVYKELFVELEWIIEEVVGEQRIKAKNMKMLKGTPKKWQILDDKVYDRGEIEKLQIAARAPTPDELDMYKEKHDRPMALPINNTNAALWRDEPQAIDTADFDPKFLEYDRERRKNYYLDRYEKPKAIAEQ